MPCCTKASRRSLQEVTSLTHFDLSSALKDPSTIVLATYLEPSFSNTKAIRRRRRSRSASPIRSSKRVKSRSRDRRGRDVAPPRGAERMMNPPRRERRPRDDRRLTRSRERDPDHRHAQHFVGLSGGGGMRGGGGRERDVHVRELPPAANGYRGGPGMPSGRGVTVHHMPAYNNGPDSGRGGTADYRGGGDYGHMRGGYPAAPVRGRNDERERDRERELQRERERARERDRERERERDRERERERERERMLIRDREEKARQREARAAAALRTAEALRRDTARLRDEVVLRGRQSGSGPNMERASSDRGPRSRARDRNGRDRSGATRPAKGTYMNKDQVDALFLKVIKSMAQDRCRFPCTASLINDRMKQASVDDYNVSNSEYARFSNVLARFEADKIVGTTKSRDSIQVVWTKYSPAGSGSMPDSRRNTESRRLTSEERTKTRVSSKGGSLKLYFCAADEMSAPGGADAGDAASGSTPAPYAQIAELLQAHGDIMTTLAAKDASGAQVTAAQIAEDKQPAAAFQGDSPPVPTTRSAAPSAESTETDEDIGGNMAEGNVEQGAVQEGKKATTEEDAQTSAEKEDNGEGQASVTETNGTAIVSNGSAGNNAQITEQVAKMTEEKMTHADVYKRDMAWLRSAHGLIAEVTVPSSGVGYKVALMTHQRCKPCLCLSYKSKGIEGHAAPSSSTLSPILKGDRNVDCHEYTDVSEISGIVESWIEKKFPRRRDDSRGRGRARGRGDSRDGAGRGRADPEGSHRNDGDVVEREGADDNRKIDDLDTDGDVAQESNNDGRSVVGIHQRVEGGAVGGVTSGGVGAGAGTGGGTAESVVSQDDDHEEIEDVTRDHNAAAVVAAATADGVGEEDATVEGAPGIVNDDEEEVVQFDDDGDEGEVVDVLASSRAPERDAVDDAEEGEEIAEGGTNMES